MPWFPGCPDGHLPPCQAGGSAVARDRRVEEENPFFFYGDAVCYKTFRMVLPVAQAQVLRRLAGPMARSTGRAPCSPIACCSARQTKSAVAFSVWSFADYERGWALTAKLVGMARLSAHRLRHGSFVAAVRRVAPALSRLGGCSLNPKLTSRQAGWFVNGKENTGMAARSIPSGLAFLCATWYAHGHSASDGLSGGDDRKARRNFR